MARGRPRRDPRPAGAATRAPSAPRTPRASRAEPVRPEPRFGWWLLPVLVVAALVAYHPAWHGGFVWDDDHHITAPALRSVGGLWRIWFDLGATEQYYPVVHTILWGLYRICGDQPTGYHLVNIVLHATSAYLFAVILRRLAVPGAAVAAVIFALHPVHVESVAWVTEIKNTVSGVFYLWAALLYLRFDETRRARTYALALAVFVIALLAKANTSALPAGLLVVFWWQRGRLSWSRDVRPLIPFFVLGLVAGVGVAWFVYALVGAHGAEFHLTIIERVLVAGRAILFYLGKLVWPAGFIFNYPRWDVRPDVWWQYLYPAALAALAGALWWWRGRSRAPLAALLFFGLTISPGVGIVNLYIFRYAFVWDHFQYLASFGIFAIAAAGLVTAARRWRVPAADGVMMAVVGVPLACLTWQQASEYRDAETLYRATIAANPASFMAHNNLGAVLDTEHRKAEAVEQYQEAARLEPDMAPPHNNLGKALLDEGRIEDARREFAEAVRLDPTSAKAHAGLGDALAREGHPADALTELSESLRLEPDVEETHNNLGVVLDSLGRTSEAITQYRAALALDPRWAEARNNLGAALASQGLIDAAADQFAEALEVNPDYVDALRNLGQARARQQRMPEAIHAFEAALRVAPDREDVHYDLAVVLARTGATAAAIQQLQAALRLDPADQAARALLARLSGSPGG